ncbi:hypothetical protein [Streptomyces sp. NPDC004042]|uniref:hypothetical protein n=1 Tax=Streptomyces sp. NPDC004042 TaxID=3154451 RepID=UPI0033B7B66E
MSVLELPADARGLLDLPTLDGLTDDQSRGADCVWCADGPLSVAAAVNLGEQHATPDRAWFPRSCRSCVSDRARRALARHTPLCEQCTDDPHICQINRTLHLLLLEGSQ